MCLYAFCLALRRAAKDDPRRVVIVEMHVLFEDRPAGDVVFKGLDKQENLDKLKKSAVVFKESCHYKLKFVFRVQHDIVTGLRYHNGVYKAGIRGTTNGILFSTFRHFPIFRPVTDPHFSLFVSFDLLFLHVQSPRRT